MISSSPFLPKWFCHFNNKSVVEKLTMSHLSDLFHPNQIFLQIYHIWNTKHWGSMPLTSFQSRFCGSHGHNALPQFFPFRRISMTNSSFGAMDQEAGCDDAVQLRKECVPCSDILTHWHSSSSSVAAPPLAQKCRCFPHEFYNCHGSQVCPYAGVSTPDVLLWSFE